MRDEMYKSRYINKVFSVVVPHYNQNDLWKNTIDSIISQTYPSIQIVFSDDGTKDFNTSLVEQYIDNNKKENIHSSVVLTRSNNIGTVKNLNYSHQHCIGYYITHIAADDAYANKDVLMNYAISLDEVDDSTCGIYGRALKCDKDLKYINEDFIDRNLAERYNLISPHQQFKKMLQKCYIPMGACAFTMNRFRDYMPFDEEYFLIEDWPFFMKVTKAGKSFKFFDFTALLYREGGVTSGGNAKAYKDHLKLYDKEIWPYSRLLSYGELFKMTYKYDYDRHFMKKVTGPIMSEKRIKFLKKDIRLAGVLLDKLLKQKEFGEGVKEVYHNLALYLFNPYL